MSSTSTFAGNLAANPEGRTVGDRFKVQFRLVCSDRVKAADGEWKDSPPVFVSCELWGEPARALCDMVQKGQRLLVTGSWRASEWTDDQGQPRRAQFLAVREAGVVHLRSERPGEAVESESVSGWDLAKAEAMSEEVNL